SRPSVEMRRRVERLVERLSGPIVDPTTLRAIRGVEAVERAGTAEARRLLEALARGEPQARLTREASAAPPRPTRPPPRRPQTEPGVPRTARRAEPATNVTPFSRTLPLPCRRNSLSVAVDGIELRIKITRRLVRGNVLQFSEGNKRREVPRVKRRGPNPHSVG